MNFRGKFPILKGRVAVNEFDTGTLDDLKQYPPGTADLTPGDDSRNVFRAALKDLDKRIEDGSEFRMLRWAGRQACPRGTAVGTHILDRIEGDEAYNEGGDQMGTAHYLIKGGGFEHNEYLLVIEFGW